MKIKFQNLSFKCISVCICINVCMNYLIGVNELRNYYVYRYVASIINNEFNKKNQISIIYYN